MIYITAWSLVTTSIRGTEAHACDQTVAAGPPLPAIAPTPALDSQGSSPFSQHCCDTEVRCTQLVPVCFSPNLCSQVTRSTTAVECKASGSSLLQIWKQLVMFSFAFKIRQNSSVSNEGPQGLSHLPTPHLSFPPPPS